MSKIAIVVLADTNSEEGFGRVYNAMTAVQQFKAAGSEVGLYFDGTGTRWHDVLSNAEHPAHGLYASVSSDIVAVCGACADFFGVKQQVAPLGNISANEVDYQAIMADGYQILTF